MDDELMECKQTAEKCKKLSRKMLDGLKTECDAFFGGKYFFENSWRPVIENKVKKIIELEKLIKWLDGRIEECEVTLLYFCPADKTDSYTNGMFSTFKSELGEWAFLRAMRDLLESSLCTEGQRQNIEYALKKEYHLHYNPVTEAYCVHKEEEDDNEGLGTD